MSIVCAAPRSFLLALSFACLALPGSSAHAQAAPEAPESCSAFTFGHKRNGREVSTGKTRLSNDQLQYSETAEGIDGSREATIGALGNVGYELGPGHSLDLIGLYSHDGEAVSSQVAGYNDNAGSRFEQTRLAFLERQLGFLQLSGTHRLARAAAVAAEPTQRDPSPCRVGRGGRRGPP